VFINVNKSSIVDPHWFQCECRSRETNQCGSMRRPGSWS